MENTRDFFRSTRPIVRDALGLLQAVEQERGALSSKDIYPVLKSCIRRHYPEVDVEILSARSLSCMLARFTRRGQLQLIPGTPRRWSLTPQGRAVAAPASSSPTAPPVPPPAESSAPAVSSRRETGHRGVFSDDAFRAEFLERLTFAANDRQSLPDTQARAVLKAFLIDRCSIAAPTKRSLGSFLQRFARRSLLVYEDGRNGSEGRWRITAAGHDVRTGRLSSPRTAHADAHVASVTERDESVAPAFARLAVIGEQSRLQRALLRAMDEEAKALLASLPSEKLREVGKQLLLVFAPTS